MWSIGDVTVEYGGEYGISLTGWGGIQLEYELDGDTPQGTQRAGAWELSDWEHEVAAVITLPEGVALESADIRTALGDVTITGVTAGTLAAGSEMGSLALYGVEAADAALAVSMGDLTAEGLTTRSSCTVENAMGDVYLDGNFRGIRNAPCPWGSGAVYRRTHRRLRPGHAPVHGRADPERLGTAPGHDKPRRPPFLEGDQ